MYRYIDHNEKDDISLHDCRATKITFTDGTLSFHFGDGFYVGKDNPNNKTGKFCYTDRSELRFRASPDDVTVYIFTETEEETKAIRKTIPLEALAEKLDGGMKLEFTMTYRGYRSFLLEGWLWFDEEPYCRECSVYLSAGEADYCWNHLTPEA